MFKILQVILWAFVVVVLLANLIYAQPWERAPSTGTGHGGEQAGWVFQRDGVTWMSTVGSQDMGLVPEKVHFYPPAWDMELCLTIGTGDNIDTRCLKMHQWFALGQGNERVDAQ